MNEKNKQYLLAGGVIFIVLLLVSQTVSLSVLATSDIKLIDGKIWHSALMTADGAQQQTVIEFNPSTYTYANGSQLVPTKNITITFTPQQQTCIYRLDTNYDPIILNYNLKLWKYYTVGNPTLKSYIRVESSNSNNAVDLDATKLDTATLSSKDGKGTLKINTYGALRTSSQCPDSSGITVLDNNGQPRIVQSSDYRTFTDSKKGDASITCGLICGLTSAVPVLGQANCINCISNALGDIGKGENIPVASNWVGEFAGINFGDSAGTETKTSLVGSSKQGSTRFGNPQFQVLADADYFSSILYVPAVDIMPQVDSLTCGNPDMATTTTHRAIISNPSSSDASFTYTISSDNGEITPSTNTVLISGKSQQALDFVHSIPSVSVDKPYSVNIKVCSVSQFGGKCVEKSCSGNINYIAPSVIPPAPSEHTCGDKKCEAQYGETTMTCSADCGVGGGTPDCSSIANSDLKNGQCICKDGFATKYDQSTGKQTCVVPSNDEWLYYGAAALIGLVGIYLFTAKPKRGRK
jgi:hypothetical protein